MDMLRTICFYFIFIGFFFLSRTWLCDSRRLGPIEKKLDVNLDHLIDKNKEDITKQEVPSTNKTKKSSKVSIQHAVDNQDQINGKNTKQDQRVKLVASLHKTMSSKRVSRTWKVPKYSKNKQPRSDQEHPGFNLDYMQPTTHPPHHN